MYRYGRVHTAEEFQLLQDCFGFLPEHGMTIPVKGSSNYDCPQGKVGVLIPLFKAEFSCRCAKAEISLEMTPHGHHREEGNTGSSIPALPSQPTVRVVSPIRLPASDSSDLHARAQAGKGTSHIRKRQSLFMVSSSDEETESDDAGLHPRKMHKTMFVAKLLIVHSGVHGELVIP
ncbi:unnamed protein product [Lactuca saligna]|uniref:Uncharacterized protein n=1 Tax=Lactuca saligna TaxID=75948 RepID=A0AA35YFF7_LACSI|nr:unnamed protein product [Lactuca saligna]